MLLAHLVPGYFAASRAQSALASQSRLRYALVWCAALAGSVTPDLDVAYNALFRGFINHSTLWSHSLFLCLVAVVAWLALGVDARWHYARTLVGVFAFGWLSHLTLDLISHGTTLFYPLSKLYLGWASPRIVHGGFWIYVTDPVFLFEPLLFSVAIVHWALTRPLSPETRRFVLVATFFFFLSFSAAFLSFLPLLQSVVQ